MLAFNGALVKWMCLLEFNGTLVGSAYLLAIDTTLLMEFTALFALHITVPLDVSACIKPYSSGIDVGICLHSTARVRDITTSLLTSNDTFLDELTSLVAQSIILLRSRGFSCRSDTPVRAWIGDAVYPHWTAACCDDRTRGDGRGYKITDNGTAVSL